MLKHADTFILSKLKDIQQLEGHLTPESVAELAESLNVSEAHLWGVASFYSLLYARPVGQYVIRLCNSISCHLCGCGKLLEAAEKTLRVRRGGTTMDGLFTLATVSCLGACGSGPAAMIGDHLHTNLDENRLNELIKAIRMGEYIPAYVRSESASAIGTPALTGDTPKLDINDFSPSQILDAVEASGLRGRGGAAFPTGRKWRLCAETESDERFVVCNADEGEPGTYKDRYLLTVKPELLILGMILAGRAVGARKGYIYLRGEYPDARAALERELANKVDTSF